MNGWNHEYLRLKDGKMERCSREEWEAVREQQKGVVAESRVDIYKVVTEFDGDVSWYDSVCEVPYPFHIRLEGPLETIDITERSGQMYLDAVATWSVEAALRAHFLTVRLLEKCIGSKAKNRLARRVVGRETPWWSEEHNAEMF